MITTTGDSLHQALAGGDDERLGVGREECTHQWKEMGGSSTEGEKLPTYWGGGKGGQPG